MAEGEKKFPNRRYYKAWLRGYEAGEKAGCDRARLEMLRGFYEANHPDDEELVDRLMAEALSDV